MFLLCCAVAGAAPRHSHLQVRVLSAESSQFQAPPLYPPDCNWKDISAYCYSSEPVTYTENTMLVEQPNGKLLTIACTVESEWSNCARLPVNQTFEARVKRRGLEIRYLGRHGKLQKEFYLTVDDPRGKLREH
jgi:hypothetical protein